MEAPGSGVQPAVEPRIVRNPALTAVHRGRGPSAPDRISVIGSRGSESHLAWRRPTLQAVGLPEGDLGVFDVGVREVRLP